MEAESATGRTRSRDVSAALLQAAEDVLVREGPDALTIRAVAVEAGVAPMGVYNRFGSKDGLLDALLVQTFGRFEAALLEGREPDPRQRLQNCGLRYRRFALANPRHYELLFEAKVLEDASLELQSAGQAAFGVLVENVALAIETGTIRPGDPLEMAQMIWSAVHGAVSLELKGRTIAGDPEVWYPALLDLLIDGLAVRQ